MAAKKSPAKNKRKATKTTKATKKKTEQSFLKNEIIILAVWAISILLFISNFGVGGFIGNAISSFLFGIFGSIAYIVPILFFIGIPFFILNRGNRNAYRKIGAGSVLALNIAILLELILNTYTKNRSFFDYYYYSSTRKSGGGLIGGFFVKILCPSIGIIGTYVIVIVFCIIAIVLLTEKSFLRGVKKGSKIAYEKAQKDAKKQKERMEQRREQRQIEREQRRIDQTVSGVSFDTTLIQKSPNAKELTIPQDIFEPEPLDVDTKLEEITINRSEPEPEPLKAEESVPSKNKRKTKESKMEVAHETASVEQEIQQNDQKKQKEYKIPPSNLLRHGEKTSGDSDAHLRQTAMKLQQTLKDFNVDVTVTNVSCGPSVTRYELQPETGVKVSKIVGLADDIKLNLAAPDIRIEAPIPGKAAVGIEVPNKHNTAVMLRDLLETPEFRNHKSKIAFAAGRDIAGKVVVADIAKMPHVLIAGATGSGKSVCINTLIMSILYKAKPEEVRMIMIDPKVVELSVYNGIPHLLIPVVTDPKKAAGALNWAVAEMMKRYDLFAQSNVRDLEGYNAQLKRAVNNSSDEALSPLPQIVIIVDELADLMMVAPGEVEESICRLAQLARAAGIHLVLATQRPSVNVITGLIKANMPSRIAFSVSSGVDSRTIIDMNGAEKLLGKGDMLFYPAGYQKPARVQGAFVSDTEVQSVVDYLVKHNQGAQYDDAITNHVNSAGAPNAPGMASTGMNGAGDDKDVYFVDAGKFIIEKDKASIGMLQRVFKIGFNRAARIMDQLAEAGVVGEEEGTKPRKVLMSLEQFEQYMEERL